jgi:hypothetical protein
MFRYQTENLQLTKAAVLLHAMKVGAYYKGINQGAYYKGINQGRSALPHVKAGAYYKDVKDGIFDWEQSRVQDEQILIVLMISSPGIMKRMASLASAALTGLPSLIVLKENDRTNEREARW